MLNIFQRIFFSLSFSHSRAVLRERGWTETVSFKEEMEKEHIENAIANNARVAIALIARQRHKAVEKH